MGRKGGNFFEEHVEKIVLAIIGIVCVWLLIFRVFISPNVVGYDNKGFGAGEIDIHISEQAKLLKNKLNRKPEPKQAYEPRIDDFTALVGSAISDIDVSVYLPQPSRSSGDVGIRPVYVLPQVPEVNNVQVEHIRAVAYVPTEVINEERVYEAIVAEPNDIDFVTVEAKFDVVRLYENFHESFAGDNVREKWRDPCLAEPIFAAVQLQRQKLSADGSWGDWQIVSRIRIDVRKRMFGIIEGVKELPTGGMKVRMLQFNDPQVRMDMLQPEAYRIASANEEWFPPLLHRKFVKRQRLQRLEEGREARQAERAEREREREGARMERSARMQARLRPAAGSDSAADWYGDAEDAGGTPVKKIVTRRSPGSRLAERERPKRRSAEALKAGSTDDVYEEFEAILITEDSDFARISQPLTFWAHDDTVEPGRSYRYKIRLGVFNPIAGTERFSEQDKHLKNKVVLWSRFSDATEDVTIPGRLYFFPRDIQAAARTVTVQVSRYALGYWYSKDFMVRQGEVIGRSVKHEIADVEEGVVAPETVDYSTGAVLVDVMAVNDWSGGKNLRARNYFNMLYSFDGANIERVPVKTRYWAEELQAKFNEIRRSEKEPKEPLRLWTGGPTRRRGPRTTGRDYEYEEY